MNLIVCYTPLQVLVAEKIMNKYPEEDFYGVMIYSVDNAKFQYYSHRLKKRCKMFFSLHQHSERIALLREIIQLKCQFRNHVFERVFIASINDIQLQFLLSTIQFNLLYTFDDGTANIVKASILYEDPPSTWIRRWVNIILRNRYDIQKIKLLSRCHYTLYPNQQNIIEKTQVITLFEQMKAFSSAEKTVSILLGQPIYRDAEKNIRLAQQMIQQFQIDYYFPHPRETYQLENVISIDTPLIFEDYLVQHYANQKCRIYTYFSSAALNIQHDNIEVVALRVPVSEPAFIACYQLFEQVGIPVIEI